MADYFNNYNNIKRLLQESFNNANLSQTDKVNNLRLVRKELKVYLDQYEIIKKEILKDFNARTKEFPGQSQSAIKYNTIKAVNNQNDKINFLLKEGYLYVDAIRESLTGEPIKYEVGFLQGDTLIEGTISIEDLIINSSIDVDSKIAIENAAKLRLQKSVFSALANPEESKIQRVVESATSLYSALSNRLTASHRVPKEINNGQLYQLYRNLVHKNQNHNTIPPALAPDDQELDQMILEIRKNNAAYYKGGDIENIQVKFIGSHLPSISTLASVHRVIKNTYQALGSIESTRGNIALAKGLAKLLTKYSPKAAEKIDEKSYNMIVDKIKNLKGIGIIIS